MWGFVQGGKFLREAKKVQNYKKPTKAENLAVNDWCSALILMDAQIDTSISWLLYFCRNTWKGSA